MVLLLALPAVGMSLTGGLRVSWLGLLVILVAGDIPMQLYK